MAIEEQTEENGYAGCMRGDSQPRAAQKLTISNWRYVTKLGFWLRKVGSPTGDLTFTIRKVSDDSIIVSKVWGDLSSLTSSFAYKEVTFVSPTTINEEVRICGEVSTGDAENNAQMLGSSLDPKAGEQYSYYTDHWVDVSVADMCYRYTYTKMGPLPMHYR